MKRGLLGALLLTGLAAAGLGVRGQAAPVTDTLPVTPACFVSEHRSIPVQLELALSPAQRRYGLMERESLEANSGMLFVYREFRSPEHGFWMYNTRIPLDIAYLDDTGRIVSIRTMEPCLSARGSRCPTYPAGKRFIQAVEMNAGFFARNGLGVGDQLVTAEAGCPAR